MSHHQTPITGTAKIPRATPNPPASRITLPTITAVTASKNTNEPALVSIPGTVVL